MHAMICGDFQEMPGMRLTMAQVCRLWGLSALEAEDVIDALIAKGLLERDDDGRVCRPQDLLP
jgi:hypothetical protein